MLICTRFLSAQPVLVFSIYTVSSTGSITCSNPAVSFVAHDVYSGTVNYSWVGPAATYSGSHVSIIVPGTYTVTASAQNAQSTSTVLTVGINTTSPISNLNVLSQVISCGSVTTGPFNAFGNLQANVSHYFISPCGGSYVVNTPTASYKPAAPGTYTHVLVNTLTGCRTSKTFTLAYSGMSSSFPTFSLSSPTNYSFGCGSSNYAAIHIDNGSTSDPSGGAVSYTIIGPQTSTFVPASGPLGNQTQYTLGTSGQYTAVVRDNTTNCESRSAFTVVQNISGPSLGAIVPSQTLSCSSPSVKLEAVSNNVTSISYTWSFIGAPGYMLGNTITVDTAAALPTASLINIYTLTALNDGNACISTTIIPIYKNTFPPILSVAIPSTILTCITPSLVLTNQSSSGIPPGTFGVSLPVVSSWLGPQSSSLSSTFIVNSSGIYTVVIKDQNNGCTASKTDITIFDGKVYPLVNNPSGPPPFCLSSSVPNVSIYALVSGSAGDSYSWSGPSPILGPINIATVQVNAVGIYSVVVTNTASGCSTTGHVLVKSCITGIFEEGAIMPEVSLYPNPSNGLFTVDCGVIRNNLTLRIVDMMGCLIEEQPLHTGQNSVDLNTRANGIYFIFICENNLPVHSTKLIKD